MKIVANVFLTHRQIGEAEAVYKLLPNMIMKNSNVACQWLAVGKRSEMSTRWRLANESEIDNGDGIVQIKDREGFWIEQQDMLSKYLRRPDELELISASQFSKCYTKLTSKIKEDIEEDEEEDELDPEDINIENDGNYINYVITESGNGSKLPKFIKLQNPRPRESKLMRKRQTPAVLRYHKIKKENHYERWMLSELMLYSPFRTEDIEEMENNTAELYFRKEIWIRSVKARVMEHLESVEEARYMVEQSRKEIDLNEIGAEFSATHEQEQADCQDEGLNEHPDYAYMDADGVSFDDNSKIANSCFKEITIPSVQDLRKETAQLDPYQKEILNIAIKYSKDIVKSRKDGNTSPDPIYIIGHGGAGAGKSTVIHLVAKWCHLILSQSGDDMNCPYVIKTAFTGTAASNIDGQTLHSSFSFNFDNKYYSLSDKKRDEKRSLFKNLKIVIIDECSMVKSDMLYQLDLKLQELKEKVGIPFGGVAILMFGDMLQLRPVLGAFAFEMPTNPEFHATFQLENRWEMFKVINLEINHRQGKDKEYADILNRIRVGKMTEEDVIKIKTR